MGPIVKSKSEPKTDLTEDTRNVVRFELLMDAGEGAQKAGDILIKSFATSGKYVYIEPIIPAEISPPNRSPHAMSGTIVRLADFDITNIGSDSDLMLVSHEILLDRRLDDEEFHIPCKVLIDMGDEEKNKESYMRVMERAKDYGIYIIPFKIGEESLEIMKHIKTTGGRGSGKNMYYLGMLSAMFTADKKIVIDRIRKTFKRLDEDRLNKNVEIFENGYKYAKEKIDVNYDIPGHAKDSKEERILIDGNSALATGIIDAGIKLFTGYPITPASSIMHILAKRFPSYGGIVHQAEDEISAIGAAIGSYYGGTPAITCTSGPGLSLKQEFIGLAQVAEIPLTIIDVQRGGPSTGLPTRTEQSDMPAAISGGHGDNTRIVISVTNVIDCFYVPQLARYLTEKLRVPVIILSDYQTANSYKIINKLIINEMDDPNSIKDFVLKRFRLNRLPDKIEMVKTNQSIPGQPDLMRTIVGINTNAGGKISYSSKDHQRAHKIRNQKIHHVRKSLQKPEMFGPDEGDLLIVGWGSTRGVIEEAINICREEGLSVSGMQFRIVYPLPLMLKEIFSQFRLVKTVELNYGDEMKPSTLAFNLRNETLVDIKPLYAQSTGRPIPLKIIITKIKKALKRNGK